MALESTALRLRRMAQPPQAPADRSGSPGLTGTANKDAGGPGRGGAQPNPASKAAGEPTSGRVRHDSRGNAVWSWAAETGALALESTSRLLKKLELPELKVDDKPTGLTLEERDPGGGYDPYNRGKSGGGRR